MDTNTSFVVWFWCRFWVCVCAIAEKSTVESFMNIQWDSYIKQRTRIVNVKMWNTKKKVAQNKLPVKQYWLLRAVWFDCFAIPIFSLTNWASWIYFKYSSFVLFPFSISGQYRCLSLCVCVFTLYWFIRDKKLKWTEFVCCSRYFFNIADADSIWKDTILLSCPAAAFLKLIRIRPAPYLCLAHTKYSPFRISRRITSLCICALELRG